MTDRVYPSAKPNPHPPPPAANGAAAAGGPPSFPATKAQMYGATRPAYRPQPLSKQRRRRSRRGCCCACCLWLMLVIVALILLAAIAGGVFYVLYRPQRPTFSVSSLRLSTLNLTSNHLNSRIDLSVTARNPNRKLVFLYDPITIAASSSGIDIGDGSFPAFTHDTKNTTILKTALTSSSQSLDSSTASDLKKKTTIPLEIDLETKAGVKIGSLKTKKIGIQVSCTGINVAVPKSKGKPSAADSPDASCKVKIRIKIWKWTV
ncbi:NDR1/HIN1-like protein 13 [Dioscorea cayenensis subsp. rotundata]|uniref:NDR1/HIN1-like protein 13 n=1 Tax=Dioscorea cayennensis subsp. rotundata TaxID=55577 RepID=A0AB40CU79_DIOCR|nr:NDR1/HIN1-like protein 13 [Dioscorea cayenensis subsp. rotundata]